MLNLIILLDKIKITCYQWKCERISKRQQKTTSNFTLVAFYCKKTFWNDIHTNFPFRNNQDLALTLSSLKLPKGLIWIPEQLEAAKWWRWTRLRSFEPCQSDWQSRRCSLQRCQMLFLKMTIFIQFQCFKKLILLNSFQCCFLKIRIKPLSV
jgi:hypothetical protein